MGTSFCSHPNSNELITTSFCTWHDSYAIVALKKICHHDDVIKWKHFPRYWPFVRGIHRSPVNSPHKGQWRGALMFTLICARINSWVNNCKADDLRRYSVHCDVILMAISWPGMLTLVQMMACRRTGNLPLSEATMVWLTDAKTCY